jgi:glyoxylase-like metal-dependent hydrolase (beta-lactamase superfamily II)
MLTIKSFVFSPLQENTYLLINEEKQCCIIDPGCYFQQEKDMLKNYVHENMIQPVLLLNTHCHLDHVFGNKFVHETWGLLPHIHEKEKKLLTLASASADMWGMPFDEYQGELKYIKEGTSIGLEGDEMEVLFTPGHSPGSVSFYYEKGGFVIGGDVLFSGSIGRTDLPGGDYDVLIRSIQTKFFTLPDDTKVFSGHGPVTTIGFEKMNNPYVKLY